MKKILFLIAVLTLVSCSKEKPAEPVATTVAVSTESANNSQVDDSTNSYQAELESDLGIDPAESSPMVSALLGMVKQTAVGLDTRKQAVTALTGQPGGYKALGNALSFYQAKPNKSKEDLEMIEMIKSERAKIHK